MAPVGRCALLALPLLRSALAEPPALAAQSHFEVVGKKVPVAEVLAHLDADGDGGLSRSELQEGTWSWLVEEVAAGLASGVAAAEHSLAHLFERFDGDFSSSLDAEELAAAAAAAATKGRGVVPGAEGAVVAAGDQVTEERQRQMLRARASARAPAAAAGRRLDEVKDLTDDVRCQAPKGFPTAPEGWVCINETAPIFCTNKKRAFNIERCNWGGECQAGQWLQGGCTYSLCNLDFGTRCYNDTHLLRCISVAAHGRSEPQPSLRRICPGSGSSCRIFSDGVPPTRRRRTTNCHEECHRSHHRNKCHQVCHEDPPDPPVTTCVRDGCKLLSVADPAYVRRCVSVADEDDTL